MPVADILSIFSSKEISRREALARLLDQGLSPREAFEAMGEYNASLGHPVSFSLEGLQDFSQKIQQLTSHPEIVRDISKIESTDDEAERVYEAQKFVEKWRSPETLKSAGLDLPDFRLSLRVFENPSFENSGQGRTLATTQPASETFISESVAAPRGTTICGSIGYIVCGSVGKEF